MGERDPATGTPVTLPARVAVERAAPDPRAPDPAHDVEQRKREAGVDHLFPFGRPGQPLGRAHPFVFGFTAALGVITAWLLVRAATNAKSVIVMIVVAMFLAVGLNPAVERLRKFGLPRGAAVASVFLLVILFFAGFVASLVQPVTEQVTELRKNIPEYVEQLQNNRTLADWDKRYGLLERAEKAVNSPDFQNSLTDTATGIGKVAVNGIFQTITILILTLYFLSSLPQIKTFFYQLAPRSRRARVALLGDEILDRIGGYVAGQFTIAFIAGVCSYIFLSIVGVKYALALALIVAVTDLIPLIGATIGAVIVSLVAFLTGDTTDLIICAVFYLVYQQVENYLVYPRVMKRTVDVQPGGDDRGGAGRGGAARRGRGAAGDPDGGGDLAADPRGGHPPPGDALSHARPAPRGSPGRAGEGGGELRHRLVEQVRLLDRAQVAARGITSSSAFGRARPWRRPRPRWRARPRPRP